MPTGLKGLVPPSQEPVSLEELKLWCRVDDDTDNALLEELGVAARELIEAAYDRALCTQTLQATYDRFPRYSSSAVWQYNSDAIWQQRLPVTQLSGQWFPDRASFRIPRPPLQSVVSITYVDGSGNPQTADPATYNVDAVEARARVAPSYGNIWPIVRQQLNSVTVTFVAGYGDATQVPARLKTALKICVSQWYESREETGTLPEGAVNLLLSEWDGEYV